MNGNTRCMRSKKKNKGEFETHRHNRHIGIHIEIITIRQIKNIILIPTAVFYGIVPCDAPFICRIYGIITTLKSNRYYLWFSIS
jgi:hypothetical protein